MARPWKYGTRLFTDPDFGLRTRGRTRAIPSGGLLYNVADAYCECRFAKQKLGLMETLFAMERMDSNHSSLRDASRAVGLLASFQDRFVGAVSMADILNARDAIEAILDGEVSVRSGDRSWRARRFSQGVGAAVAIGWLERSGGSVVVRPCWYDDESVALATKRRELPCGNLFGSKVIQEGLYATVQV